MFPSSSAPTEFTAGVDKLVCIDTGTTLPASLAKQRALVREAVSETLSEINEMVSKLLS